MTRRALGWVFFCACQLSSTGRKSEPSVALDALPAGTSACAGAPFSIALEGRSPALSFDGVHVAAPRVRFTQGETTVAGNAFWNAASSAVEISAEALSPGAWRVLLTRESDGAEVDAGTLQVADSPVIERVLGAAVCAGSDVEQVFLVRGRSLQSASFRLEGFSWPVMAQSNPEGTEASVRVPSGLALSGPFPLVVSRAGCEARFEPGIVVAEQAHLTSYDFGPKRHELALDGTLTAARVAHAGSQLTVRFRGAKLTSGSRVHIGEVEASTSSATEDTLSATFDALPAGVFSVSVSVGSCVSTAEPITVAQSELHVDHFGADALLDASDAFLEVFGDFSSAGEGIATYLDVDADPITTRLIPLRYDTRLQSDRRAYRARASEALNAGGPFDVHVLSFSPSGDALSGVSAQALRVEARAPRIVWHDSDWLPVSGGDVTLYGCGFDGASFSLIDAATAAEIPAPQPLVSAASDWAKRRFRCRPGEGEEALREARFRALRAPAGLFRFRVKTDTARHDDLYPIAIYADAPSAREVVREDEVTLARARRMASALIAPDSFGRKYFYVLGGSAGGSLGLLVGDAVATLEFSALDPAHRLVGFEPGPGGQLGWPFSDASASLPLVAPSVFSDGTHVVVAGGAPTEPSAGVWLSRVASEEDGMLRQRGAPVFGKGGNVPPGTHHYRVATKWWAEQATAGILETPASLPLTVRTSEPGHVSFSFNVACGPAYTKPEVVLFRSDTPGIADESFVFGAVARVSPDAGCEVGAPKEVEVTVEDDRATPDVADIPVPAGVIYPFVRAPLSLPAPRALLSGALAPGRALVLLGGNADGSASAATRTRQEIAFSAEGVPVAVSEAELSDVEPFFGASIGQAPSLDGQLDAPFGVRASSSRVARLRDGVYRHVDATPPGDRLVGFGFARAGGRAFLFGGARVNDALVETALFDRGLQWEEGALAPVLSPSSTLSRARAEMASAFAPPYVHLAGGLGCEGFGVCQTLLLLDSLERVAIE